MNTIFGNKGFYTLIYYLLHQKNSHNRESFLYVIYYDI